MDGWRLSDDRRMWLVKCEMILLDVDDGVVEITDRLQTD